MKQLLVVAVALGALAGCKKTDAPAASGSGSSTPAKDERDEMLTKMSEFTDRVCACTDAACASKVSDELQQWTVDFANKTAASKALPTAEQLKKVEELQGKFVGCVQKLPPAQGSGSGSGSAEAADSPACQRFAKAMNGELNCMLVEDKQREELRTIVHKVLESRADAGCNDGYDKVKAQAKAIGCPAPE
ncbi:hypothetical protein BH11MYX2_BH11MYX2_28410 [soil metagenome]